MYLGDAATEEGVFYESVNFAALKQLNVIYVCENNMYSVYTPLSERQPRDRNIRRIAKALGINNTRQFDDTNAIKLHEGIKQTLETMDSEGGPAFIEVKTYRWREHCGPNYDNDLGYRAEDEFSEYKKKDPAKLLRETMHNKNEWFEEWEEQQIMKIKQEIDNAFLYAENSEFPDKEEKFENVYATRGEII